MFWFTFVYGFIFVDLRKALLMRRVFETVHMFMTEFGRPEVTQCG